jgi:hypothetical protein
VLPITEAMSIEATLARVETIRQAIADPAELIGSSVARTGGTGAPASSPFATALAQASAGYPQTASTGEEGAQSGLPGAVSGLSYASSALPGYSSGVTGASPGARLVAAAETQIGQSEQPPGSNESPAIAEYRSTTAGAMAGAPWCAYFASWAARQAGEPIGAQGQGLGSVSEIWSWAQSTGRAIANGPGVVPQPGDLIVFGGEHVGIVKAVLPNGQIQTIEGNFENKVSANVRSAGEATGYVNLA